MKQYFTVFYRFVSNLGLKTIQKGKFIVLYQIQSPFLILKKIIKVYFGPILEVIIYRTVFIISNLIYRTVFIELR